MNKTNRHTMNLYMLIAICLGITVAIIANHWLVKGIALIVMSCIIIVMSRLQLKTMKLQYENSVVAYKDQLYVQSIKLVEHIRHDWMNHNQVIMGYIQLQKSEKVIPYVQSLSHTNYRDSALSKLRIPSLIYYLLYYRVEHSNMSIHVDIEKELDIDRLSIDREIFSEFIQVVVESWESHANTCLEPSRLQLHFEKTLQGLKVVCIFQGTLEPFTLDLDRIFKFIQSINQLIQVEQVHALQEMIVHITLPYRYE